MRSRWVRLILGAAVLAGFGTAAFLVKLFEQRVAKSREAELAFSSAARDVVNGVSDLRISEAAYVATGQDVAFWAPKAAAAARSVAASVALLRSNATSDAARAALDAASAKAADFYSIDQRALEYLETGMPVMASDVILSDGGEAATALLGSINTAQAAEQQAAAAAEIAQRRREAVAAGGAAGLAFLAIVLLIPRTRASASTVTAPENTAYSTPPLHGGLGLRTAPDTPQSTRGPHEASSSLRAVSNLCTDFGRVSDIEELKSLLAQAANLMEANGLLVWVGSADDSELLPALAHGYAPEMLARIPSLRRSSDNAVAAAFRTGKLQIVLAHEGSPSGAIVAPMLSSRGCVGVVSAETPRGAETSDSLQAMAAIFAAQLAGVLQTIPESQEQRATGTI